MNYTQKSAVLFAVLYKVKIRYMCFVHFYHVTSGIGDYDFWSFSVLAVYSPERWSRYTILHNTSAFYLILLAFSSLILWVQFAIPFKIRCCSRAESSRFSCFSTRQTCRVALLFNACVRSSWNDVLFDDFRVYYAFINTIFAVFNAFCHFGTLLWICIFH